MPAQKKPRNADRAKRACRTASCALSLSLRDAARSRTSARARSAPPPRLPASGRKRASRAPRIARRRQRRRPGRATMHGCGRRETRARGARICTRRRNGPGRVSRALRHRGRVSRFRFGLSAQRVWRRRRTTAWHKRALHLTGGRRAAIVYIHEGGGSASHARAREHKCGGGSGGDAKGFDAKGTGQRGVGGRDEPRPARGVRQGNAFQEEKRGKRARRRERSAMSNR